AIAGDNPPEIHSEVFGITCNPKVEPQCVLSEGVHGFLTCVQKVCLTDPTKTECTVPGNSQGVPFQVQEGDFTLTSDTTTCAVKGQKGTCKVLKYDHILEAVTSGSGHACPGGFVPDFVPDPFIGRTSTCDVSHGKLIDTTEPPTCSDGTPATSL